MLNWDRKYKKRLEDNNLEAEDHDRYMDDVRTWLHSIKPGWRWVGEELLFCESWRKEDLKEGNVGLRKSRQVLEGMMNNIHNFLKMTMETGDEFEDGKLPTLDINLWVGEDGLVLHTFYEKPMSNNQVLHKYTAMPENTKIAALTQELVRRMKNSSELLCQEERNVVIDNYTQKLVNSDYGVEKIRRIIVSGLMGYERKRKEAMRTGRPLHVGAKDNKKGRIRKKLLEKSSWFKSRREKGQEELAMEEEMKKCQDGSRKKDEVEDSGRREKKKQSMEDKKKEVMTTSVMFVENTVGGILAKRLREKEERISKMTGYKIRIVEKGGQQLRRTLPNTNPWKGMRCERTGCVTCEQGEEVVQDCFKRNVLYESRCVRCEEKDEKEKKDGEDMRCNFPYIYVGETARSINERSKEHWDDWASRKEDSHIRKHWEDVHQGEEGGPEMKFRVAKSFQDCLTRQVSESVRIQLRGKVLNSKSVYSRCKLPRLVVEGSEDKMEEDKKRTEQERKEKLEEEGVLSEQSLEFRIKKRKDEEVGNVRRGRPSKRRKVGQEPEDWGERKVEEAGSRTGSEENVDWEKVKRMRQKEISVNVLSKEEIWARRMIEDILRKVVTVTEVEQLLTEDMEEFLMLAGLNETKLKKEQPECGPVLSSHLTKRKDKSEHNSSINTECGPRLSPHSTQCSDKVNSNCSASNISAGVAGAAPPEVQSVAGAVFQEVQSVAKPAQQEVQSVAGAALPEVQSVAVTASQDMQSVAGATTPEVQSVAAAAQLRVAPLEMQSVAEAGPPEVQSVALGLVATRIRQWGEGGPTLETLNKNENKNTDLKSETPKNSDRKRKWAKAKRGTGRKDGLVQQKLDMFVVRVLPKLQLTGEKKFKLKTNLEGQTEDQKTL